MARVASLSDGNDIGFDRPAGGPALALPSAHWLRGYRVQWLRSDLVAGLTLAAYLLPAGIGDASLAGLPPEAGIYACLFSGLVFWIFCSSRHTVITVTSALSLVRGVRPLSRHRSESAWRSFRLGITLAV
jgi:Sulfate permease family